MLVEIVAVEERVAPLCAFTRAVTTIVTEAFGASGLKNPVAVPPV